MGDGCVFSLLSVMIQVAALLAALSYFNGDHGLAAGLGVATLALVVVAGSMMAEKVRGWFRRRPDR